jgi:dolichol-phosphate mannosyltransferase
MRIRAGFGPAVGDFTLPKAGGTSPSHGDDFDNPVAAMTEAAAKETLSVIVPLFNEEENVEPLIAQTVAALERLDQPFEIILIDDGSTDRTNAPIMEAAGRDDRIKIIRFRRNHGQTAAMMAGIDHSSGHILIPMDGDLQNDPADIPALLAKLDEGFDVVSGWRADRKDNKFTRTMVSRMANWLISRISGVRLHDYGCSLKAYRRDVIEDVRLYGEMHRFIPIYTTWFGGRVTEIPVRHHPRRFGRSKYGLERVFKVVLDLLMVQFLTRYETKPLYVFGMFGLLSLFFSVLVGLLALYLKLVDGVSFISTPLPLLTVVAFLTGLTMILMGLLAEMLVRVYYESQGKPIYLIKETHNFKDS